MTRRIYNGLSRFFDSVWYPAAYAVVCVISGVHGKAVYVPMACVLATMAILSCFFAQKLRNLIVPVLMSFYCIGVDHPDGFNENNAQLLAYYDMDGFLTVIAIGAVTAVCLFARSIRLGVFTKEKQGNGRLLWGILLMDAAFILNGIGSPHWQIVNLAYGLIFAGVITFFYFWFRGCLTGEEDRTYLCRVIVWMSAIAFLQLLVVSLQHWQEGTFFAELGGEQTYYPDRKIASLGWGITTSVGGVLVLGVPAAMYLATRNRRGWLWCLAAMALAAMNLVFRNRSPMIVSGLLFLLGLGIGCFWGNNKKQLRIIGIVLGAAVVSGVVWLATSESFGFSELLTYTRLDMLFEDSRWTLWGRAWEDMKSAPLFGVGFEKGAYAAEDLLGNVFSNMYHGIAPQFYGSMGFLGICALGKHLYDLGKSTLRRFRMEKLFALMVPGMILMMSMADNFFFYANYQFVYCVFLALLEKTGETDHENFNRDRIGCKADR